jgi:hypothetical protein
MLIRSQLVTVGAAGTAILATLVPGYGADSRPLVATPTPSYSGSSVTTPDVIEGRILAPIRKTRKPSTHPRNRPAQNRISKINFSSRLRNARKVKTIGTKETIWDRLADCESGEWVDGGKSFVPWSAKWDDRSGGYQGGLQFAPSTWDNHKPDGYPDEAYLASKSQQIKVGEIVQADEGWDAWPVCSRKVGLQ